MLKTFQNAEAFCAVLWHAIALPMAGDNELRFDPVPTLQAEIASGVTNHDPAKLISKDQRSSRSSPTQIGSKCLKSQTRCDEAILVGTGTPDVVSIHAQIVSDANSISRS